MSTSLRCILLLASAQGCFIGGDARDARWDLDRDGVARPADCDDTDPLVFPGSVERCDDRDVDEDCNGLADDADVAPIGVRAHCRDADGDGLGNPADSRDACDAPSGYVLDCTDCDDDRLLPCTTTVTTPCGGVPVAVLTVEPSAGEQGVTTFTADASASQGSALTFAFDWGQGPGAAGGPATAQASLAQLGLRPVRVTVADDCGQSDTTEAFVAVGAVGNLLWVTTARDESDAEETPPVPLGTGLSLREALSLSQGMPGPQVIALSPGLGTVSTGPAMPALSDTGGVLVGGGQTIDGTAGGRIDVTGTAAVIADSVLTGFTDGTNGALRLAASGILIQGVTIRDSAMGLAIEASNIEVRTSRLLRNGDPQVFLDGAADFYTVEIADGDGVGVAVHSGGSNSTLALCRIYGHGGSGIDLARDVEDFSLLDSSVVGNGNDGITVDPSKVEGVDLRNVVVAFNDGYGLSRAPKSYRNGSPAFDLFYGNGSGDCGCTLGAAVRTDADPGFVDWGGGDLTPAATSPLRDAGTSATGVDRNGPAVGTTWDGTPDIGGVEGR